MSVDVGLADPAGTGVASRAAGWGMVGEGWREWKLRTFLVGKSSGNHVEIVVNPRFLVACGRPQTHPQGQSKTCIAQGNNLKTIPKGVASSSSWSGFIPGFDIVQEWNQGPNKGEFESDGAKSAEGLVLAHPRVRTCQ